MVWGQIAGAAIGGLGAALGGSSTSSKPWGKATRRALKAEVPNITGMQTPAYPTAPPIGPMNPYEAAAIGGYGNLANTSTGMGNYYMDGIDNGMYNNPSSPYAQGFGGAPDMWTNAAMQGPPQLTNPGLNPNLGMFESTAGITADPNAAINQLMSGNAGPWQDAFSAAMDLSNQNFEERTIPQLGVLDDQFSGGQGGAGGLKIAQRMAQDMARDQNRVGAQYALDAGDRVSRNMTTGANLATNAALTQSGQNLQGAGLGVQYGTNVGNQAFNYGSANQGAGLDWMGRLAQGAGIGANAAGAQGSNQLGWGSQIPNAYNVFAGGPNALATGGNMHRAITDPLYANEWNRQQYNNNAPMMMSDWRTNALMGIGGMGSNQQTGPANPWAAGALGAINGLYGAPGGGSGYVPTSASTPGWSGGGQYGPNQGYAPYF